MSTVVAVEAERRVAELDGVPLTLLPVRLETRFVPVAASSPDELRIRVYPEQVHLDAHQPALTPAELESGKAYWRNRWSPATADRAWRELIRGIRAQRAAWIVRSLTPTNTVGDPAGPAFPPVPSRPAGDAPLAVRAMPTRWVALGYDAAGHEILRKWFDHPVAEALLATGALADGEDLGGEQAIAAYLGWAADYAKAVQAGMAVTITAGDLAAGQLLGKGFARLIVLGVDVESGAAGGAAELAALLAAHEVTDGLGYLRAGTPTNNLESAAAGAGAIAVADPTLAPKAPDANWSAARRLSRALGVERTTLDRVPGARDLTALVASDVVRATWAGSLGYFTDQLLSPLIGDGDLAALRDHAVAHLQPLGPLPTLRVGSQPLGVLPVLAPHATPADAFAGRVAAQLRKLRPMWKQATPRVPHLLRGHPPNEPLEQVLLTILRRSPWTTRVWYRRAFGPLIAAGAGGVGEAMRFQAVLRTIAFLDGFGHETAPRIAPFAVADLTRHLSIPLIGASIDGKPPDLSYLEAIRVLTTQPDGRQKLTETQTASVLAALARFAALQELDLVAARIELMLVGEKIPPIAWRTTEINAIGKFTQKTPLERTTTPNAKLGGRTLSEEVARRQTETPPSAQLAELRQFQGAATRLARSDPATVDVAFRAYLGACSHRLDAWLTSLGSSQLDSVRAKRPSGTHVGGFGYVEGLVPEATADSLGYVLGPSLAHAATAGILRSGYLAQRATGNESLDVELSSDRVKLALELTRGVREGVPLAVLLGYRLERGLRDDGISVAILPLRELFALRTPPSPETPTTPVESTPPNNVVDAVALADRWRADREAVIALLAPRLTLDKAGWLRLRAQLDKLLDTYDAVGDVMLAETVHQVSRGQAERAQAASRFLDRQEPPVEPEVTATPRTSTGFAQRCVVALSATQPIAAWHALADPRAAAEPRINAWLAALLGAPAGWSFSGRCVDAQRVTVRNGTVTISELGLSALSLVVAAVSGSADQPTELEERIARRLAVKLGPLAPGEGIELLGETSGKLGLAAFAALASAAMRVLRRARPADARAFAPPDTDADAGLDGPDMKARADGAAQGYRRAVTLLDAQLAAPSTTQAELLTALGRMARVGIAGSLPPLGLLDGGALPVDEDGRAFATTVAGAARDRLARLDTLEATTPAPADAAAHHAARIATVFGDAFPVLGAFRIPAGSDAARALPAAQQTALLRGDALAPVTWMTRMARVRPELDALWHLLVSAEAMSGYDTTAFAVVQLPHVTGSAWAALAFDGARPAADAAITVHRPSGSGGAIGALAIDSWTEQVPLATETAGMTFHYDAPSNRAPQTAIVAVPPQVTARPWSLQAIADTVREAFDLAVLRGVTLQELPGAGAVLPALYLPSDPGGHVPSVDVDTLVDRFATAPPVMGRD